MIKERKIEQESIKRLSKLFECVKIFPELKALYLFGSFADGTASSLSDIDISYLAFPELNNIENLHYEICSFLKTEEVDLVNLKNIPLSPQYHIISKGRLLYCSSDIFLADFKERIMIEYFDFEPYLKEYHRCFSENMLRREINGYR